MSYPAWPPPQPGPAPRRGTWLKPAVAATLALAVVVSLVTGWFVYTDTFAEDSGLAQCEQFKDQAAGVGTGRASDFDRYREVRDAFEDSRHDDIRRAGIHWADVSWQTAQAENTSMRSTYQRLWLSAIRDVLTACADHDVDVPLELPG